MRQESNERKAVSYNAVPPPASLYPHRDMARQSVEGCEKGGRGFKGSAPDSYSNGRVMTPREEHGACNLAAVFCEAFDKSKTTSASAEKTQPAIPLEMDGEKKGRKRPSRKSRRALESAVAGAGLLANSSGETREAAPQKQSLEFFPLCSPSSSSTRDMSIRVEQQSSSSSLRFCTTSGNSSTSRAKAAGRLRYVPVANLKSRPKEVLAIPLSKLKEHGKFLATTHQSCWFKCEGLDKAEDKEGTRGENRDTQKTNGHALEISEAGSGVGETRCDMSGSDSLPAHGRNFPQDKFYAKHLSSEQLRSAMAAGKVFKASFRVNPYNRAEAYATVEGVPLDIRIDGFATQNRAVDGDVVALQVDSPSSWAKLKAFAARQTQAQLCGHEAAPSSECADALIADRMPKDDILSSSATEIEIVNNGPGIFKERSVPENGHREHKHKLDGQSNQTETKASGDVDLTSSATLKLAGLVRSMAGRRPTGKVMGIMEKSPRRETIIGLLDLHQQPDRLGTKNGVKEKDEPSQKGCPNSVLLTPLDSRLPKMVVFSSNLPPELLERLQSKDPTLEHEMLTARMESWKAENYLPRAFVKQSLGHGGDIETQTSAILFENAIHGIEFPPSAMACLPKLPWKIPNKEIKRRRDLRAMRIFSIDPPTAKDLDDALSIEVLDDGWLRLGVHIADVSYFVKPNTALDKEAQSRSTSVYLIQRVLPMLPSLLCDELCSLNPGVERLAFSVMWLISPTGDVTEQWMGRTVIRSCAKLTYAHAQAMIEGGFAVGGDGNDLPELHGNFTWQDVISDVLELNKMAKNRRESRIGAGALRLENSKLVFELDTDGVPFDSTIYEHKDSNFLVEEFMLMANMSVAKVISNAFPDCALLRRHPEPNVRKLQEFEGVCLKQGFDLDVSSAGTLHASLQKIRERVKEDPTLFSILMLFATKPMQLAKYFSTGEFKDNESEWAHYALATPFYTHFTSPIRRYPDLVVHRTLAAVLDAEEVLSRRVPIAPNDSDGSAQETEPVNVPRLGFLSGPFVEKGAALSAAARSALDLAASKHKIPGSAELAQVAAHCNERKLASRNVAEASTKLYLWAMYKSKQGCEVLSESRVLALGPKFMSVYVSKIGMERRIYYEDIEGLSVEWFEATGTLVLDICPQKISNKKQNSNKNRGSRTVADVATIVNPTDTGNSGPENYDEIVKAVEDIIAGRMSLCDQDVEKAGATETDGGKGMTMPIEPAVLPLTLTLLSTVPVSLHPTGGNSKPVDVSARLYLSSYQTLNG